MRPVNSIRIAGFFILSLIASSLSAHPHSWVTLQSEFLLDEQGTADGDSSELAVRRGFFRDHGRRRHTGIRRSRDGLTALAEGMVKRLAGHQYFSELNIGDEAIDLPVPENYELTAGFVDGENQLSLQMRFKLAQPRSLEQTIAWRVFDPTYYVDMRHEALTRVVVRAQPGTECSRKIERPNPTQAMIRMRPTWTGHKPKPTDWAPISPKRF